MAERVTTQDILRMMREVQQSNSRWWVTGWDLAEDLVTEHQGFESARDITAEVEES